MVSVSLRLWHEGKAGCSPDLKQTSVCYVLILCVEFDYCYFYWITLTSQWRLFLSWRSQLSVQRLSGIYSPSISAITGFYASVLSVGSSYQRHSLSPLKRGKDGVSATQQLVSKLQLSVNCQNYMGQLEWSKTICGKKTQPEIPVSSCWPRKKSSWPVPFQIRYLKYGNKSE